MQKKDEITIVVTDSGLGGMSVCAGIEAKFALKPKYREVNLIFFNSHAEQGCGYNSMPTLERKAEVFSSALIAMEKKYLPDIILIACNTLSVVYPHTNFGKETKTNVMGIIDFGTEMVLDELKKDKLSRALILGTITTISAGVHIQSLIEKGIPPQRLYGKAMPNLESEIQYDPVSSQVKKMIREYLEQAFGEMNYQGEKVLAALCCTHYGYSKEIFETELNKLTDGKYIVLNPNERMIEAVIRGKDNIENDAVNIKVEVISRAKLDEQERLSISKIIQGQAPLSSKALVNYSYDSNLFEFRKAI